MSQLLTLADWLELPCKYFAKAIGWLLLVLTAVILYDVIGRRFFSTGSFKLQELEWHLHGAIAVLGFGWAYINNAHVRIDILTGSFSDSARLRIEIAAIVLFLIPFMVLLVWYGYDFTLRSFMRSESSPGGVGLTNRWIIKSAVPIGALLMLCGATSVLLRCLVALRRPDLLSDPWKTTPNA